MIIYFRFLRVIFIIFVRLVRPQTARKLYLQELGDRLHAAFPLSVRNEHLLPRLVVEHDRRDQSWFPVSTRTAFPLMNEHLLLHLGVEHDRQNQPYPPVPTRTKMLYLQLHLKIKIKILQSRRDQLGSVDNLFFFSFSFFNHLFFPLQIYLLSCKRY